MGAGASVGQKFDFDYLHNYTHNSTTPQQYIYRPFPDQSVLALSFEGCVAAVGTAINYYSRLDVYDRVLLWRLPLIALWATTTLPALGLFTQIFTLTHLIADPIDTVWSLLYKLDLAKRTTRWAQRKDGTELSFVFPSESAVTSTDVASPKSPRITSEEVSKATKRTKDINDALDADDALLKTYFHDVPALIITAYDEWGYGEEASKAMNFGFNSRRWSGIQRTVLRKRCAKAAFFIASDRVSRFLPSAASGMVFVVQIFAGFWKTLDGLSDTYDASNPASSGLNRTPHNIAFGALFFWLPFVVLLTAHVGGSQTSHMIPQVLEDLQHDFADTHPLSESQTDQHPLTDFEIPNFPDISGRKHTRWSCGGLPVWQAEKYKDFRRPTRNDPDHRWFAYGAMILSFCIVAVPTACAVAVSWRTPTQGFGCRAMTQLSFLVMWVVNAFTDWLFFVYAGRSQDHSHHHNLTTTATTTTMISDDNNNDHSVNDNDTIHEKNGPRYQTIYYLTLTRDIFLTLSTITTLTWTALGIFNQCSCWCKYSFFPSSESRYLSFPQDPYTFHLIKSRLEFEFPLIVGGALITQVLAFVGVAWFFRAGHRVLMQRDIDSVLRSRKSVWVRVGIWWGRIGGLVWSWIQRVVGLCWRSCVEMMRTSTGGRGRRRRGGMYTAGTVSTNSTGGDRVDVAYEMVTAGSENGGVANSNAYQNQRNGNENGNTKGRQSRNTGTGFLR